MTTQTIPPSGTPPRVPVRVLMLALLFGLLSVGAWSAADSPPASRTGLLVFSTQEAAPFLRAMGRYETEIYPGFRCVVGQIAGETIVLLHSPPGMVNAALNAQRLIDRCGASRLIVSGTAGAINPDLPIGTVVVPGRWAQHQRVAVLNPDYAPPPDAVAPPYGLEYFDPIAVEPPHGRVYPQPVIVQPPVGPQESQRVISADESMILTAVNALPDALVDVTGVSGDAFVDADDYRHYLWRAFGAQIVDMESAAVAQVAYANGTPFLAVRAVSDRAGGGIPGEIAQHYESAAEAAARAVITLLHGENPR